MSDETTTTSIRVDPTLWKAFRVQCLMEDRQIGEVLEMLLRSWVAPSYIEGARAEVHTPLPKARTAAAPAPKKR